MHGQRIRLRGGPKRHEDSGLRDRRAFAVATFEDERSRLSDGLEDGLEDGLSLLIERNSVRVWLPVLSPLRRNGKGSTVGRNLLPL